MGRSKLRIVAPWLDRNAQDCSTSLGATRWTWATWGGRPAARR